MSAMRRIGEYLGLVEDTGRYDDEYDYEYTDQTYGGYAGESETRVSETAHQRPVDPRSADQRHPDHRHVERRPAKRERPAQVADPDAHRRPTAVPSLSELSRIVTLHPTTYNEARSVGENYREGVPVIMNLTEMDDSDAKRLVDFAAGLVFATRGTIERVTNKVFLLSPANVSVTAEERQRIVEGGFFNQS